MTFNYTRCLLAITLLLIPGTALAQDCGPGPHWVDTCPAGTDESDSGALVGIDLNMDCGEDMSLILSGPTLIERQAGSPHSINTEMISMDLTGGIGIWAGQGPSPYSGVTLDPTVGMINELAGDPALAHSFFDVFFEVNLGGGFAYNHDPLIIEAEIDRVPPTDISYIHPTGCLPLYDVPPGQTRWHGRRPVGFGPS